MDGIYRFHIGGHLDDRWSDWLAGLTIQRQEDGTTVLSGPLTDQAALYGIIASIRDLGLPLLEVRRVDVSLEHGLGQARGSPSPPPDSRTRAHRLDDLPFPTIDTKGDFPCD